MIIMFNSDEPIEGINEDLLNRGKFVKQLSNSIINYDFNKPLVLGLYGEWGSGKSSIINMTTKIIEDENKKNKKNENIKIIKFNPWNYSEQNNLLLQYFNCLDNTFNSKNEKENKAKDLLNKYFNNISKQIYKDKNDELFYKLKLNEYLNRIKNDVTFEKLGVNLGNIFSRDESNQTLSSLKKDFTDFLEGTNLKILVIIDNIDRCNNLEIKQIFQLVKSIADFPRITYLLSFDNKLVLKSLKNSHMIFSDKYLEKIIQVSFNVPSVRPNTVLNVLIKEIDSILQEYKIKFIKPESFSFFNYFKPYINNIRNVNRFCNLLKFELPIIKDDICINDFLLISLLNLFEPDIYEEIKDNKSFFAPNYNIFEFATNKKQNETENVNFLENLLNNEEYKNKENIKGILSYLFPIVKYTFEKIPFPEPESFKKDSRICLKQSFDNYFTLNLSDDDISNRQIQLIIESSNDKETFKNYILNLDEDKLIPIFLEKLNYLELDSSKWNISIIIETLLDYSDLFWEENIYFRYNTNSELLTTLYDTLLKSIKKQEERFNILDHAIKNVEKSVYSYVNLINKLHLNSKKFSNRENSENELIVNLEQLESLKDLASQKINSTPIDLLLKNKYSHFILIIWSYWAKKEDLTEFFKKIEKKNEYLIKFITLFKDSNFDPKQIGLDLVYNPLHFNLQAIEKYGNILNIINKLKDIFAGESIKDNEDINRFLEEAQKYCEKNLK